MAEHLGHKKFDERNSWQSQEEEGDERMDVTS